MADIHNLCNMAKKGMQKGQWTEKNIEKLIKLKEQEKRDNTKQSNKTTK